MEPDLKQFEKIIIQFNADNGIITSVNNLAASLLGISKKKLIGSNYFDLLDTIGAKKLAIIKPNASINDCNQKDNNLLVSYANNPLSAIDWTILFLTDIHQYILVGCDNIYISDASHKYNQLQTYLDNILNQIPGYLYWKDTNSVYLGCNRNFAKVAGLNSSQEIVGKTDYDLIWGKTEADLFRKGDIEVLASVEKLNFEEPQLQANGKSAVVLANKIPLRDKADNIIGVLGAYNDITARKNAEEALKRANQGLGLIAASIAHELRTPLATIYAGLSGLKKNMLTLIQTYKLATKHDLDVKYIPTYKLALLEKNINNVFEEVNYSHLIINMLLVKVHHFEDDSRSDFQTCSIKNCVEKSLARYPLKKDDKNIIIISGEDFLFKGIELFVVHIFFNLLKNALYYLHGVSNASINITLKPGENFNAVSFKDSGKGIEKEAIPHIFEKFYSRTLGGAGVGLAFCENVMHDLGGEILCFSEVNKFTEFVLKFPVVKSV